MRCCVSKRFPLFSVREQNLRVKLSNGILACVKSEATTRERKRKRGERNRTVYEN